MQIIRTDFWVTTTNPLQSVHIIFAAELDAPFYKVVPVDKLTLMLSSIRFALFK